MYRIKRDRAMYVNCILAMVILMIAAVLGPQLLFAVQDNHKQGEIFSGERSQMDMTFLNVGYPKVLRDRLISFAQGQSSEKQYYATATDCTVDAEGYSILDNVLNREWVTFLNDMGILLYNYEAISKIGYTIDSWKRYIIYDENIENGVAIMAWYFDVSINDSIKLQLLVDVEDDTLYHINIAVDEKWTWEHYGYPEWHYFDADVVNTLILYWCYYYDAGDIVKASDEDYLKSIGYGTDYEEIKKKSDGKENIVVTEIFDAYGELMMDGDSTVIQKELPYGENMLNWEMKVQQDVEKTSMVISMGISDIVELVPEFS